MKKNQKKRKEEVEKLLLKQKIRDIKQIEAYKLDICHHDSAGIDLRSAEHKKRERFLAYVKKNY